MIRKEEDQAELYIKTIAKLESRERNMLEKLKKTQTQHALVAEDLERINRNQDPTGPLSSLKHNMNSSGKKMSVSSQKPVSPRKQTLPKAEPPVKKEQPPVENGGSSYYDRMYGNNYGEHQLYSVTDYYR